MRIEQRTVGGVVVLSVRGELASFERHAVHH